MYPIEDNIKDFIRYWTFPLLRPRRFHAFGVGMPKSGTHSLEAIFKGYRTMHEPRKTRFMDIIMRHREGGLTDSRARDLVRRLDRSMWLELNSSWINYFLLEMLVEEYPQAKFVLTIRDCYSWLDSMFNQLLGRDHADYQVQFHHWFGESIKTGRHEDGDKILAEHGLWPLDTWLRYWSEHNSHVLNNVPTDRLLIVRTPEIRHDIPRMADFLGVQRDTLDASHSHEFKAAKKFGLLSQIDEEYLQGCVDKHCKDLMERFFPEIRQLSDVRGYQQQGTQVEMSNTAG
jgi:hypothetical protein